MKKHLLLFAMGIYALNALAQTRYLDDVFTRSEIVRTNNVTFGENYYFLNFPPAPAGTSSSTPKDTVLLMDLYTPPANDTAASRPLIVYLHTGSFLPKYINGSATGNNKDSSVVEICSKFAQKGYVVAAINYRLGWNPIAPSQIERTRQILNAVYRSIHDAQTCVRFFKKDAATVNDYKIDSKHIYLIGQGSGGYSTLAYPFLDKTSETELPKFLDGNGNSVINQTVVGTLDGGPGLYNIYNHPGYSNEVCMSMNIGGCIGDISWMDNIYPTVRMAGVHCRKDMFAPFDSGNVIVPSTQQVVVFVQGTRPVIAKAVQQGLNQIFVDYNFTDDISNRAYSLNPKNTHEGLFQIERPDLNAPYQEGSPWEWWDSTAVATEAPLFGQNGTTIHTNGLLTNPDMTKAKAVAYIDTIVGFFAPRMYLVLQDQTVGLNNEKVEFNIFPNPATEQVNVSLAGNEKIYSIEIIDLQGRVVKMINNINTSVYNFNRNGIANGMYSMKINTSMGLATETIILQ
jgi:hypothetical protein